MKLTELEIQGFKSFADRVKLRFDAGITGIVGPNGCGKSNVIDAIRWVLGEQKTRNLRSDKMENVIFNGTDKRKRAAMAEVSMTLENNRNILPTEYATVTITRRLYRDGDSEYLLNGVACRLKDISNLLMDTGIGADSYAIIELSAVEDLLTDKNNARRQLFEEAAGISKYKLRKKETLARMDETQGHLTRAEDLLTEIEKNLRATERQAKRAEQYLEVKKSYRQLSSQFALLRLRAFRETQQTVEAEEQELVDSLTQLQARIAEADAKIQELQAELIRREEQAADQRRILADHQQAIQKAENDQALRQERGKYLVQREAQLADQLSGEKDRRSEYEAAMLRLEGEIDEANETYDKQEFLLVELEKELEELRTAITYRQRQFEETQGQVRSREGQLQGLQREFERRTIQIQGLQRELQRTQSESAARVEEMEDYAARLRRLKADMQGMEAEQQRLIAARATHEQQVADRTARLNQLREELYQQQRLLDMRQQEYTLTKGLVESLEGFSESVKFLKKNTAWSRQATLVSEAFYTPDAHKLAVEAVLEPWLSYYVVETRAEAAAGLRLLRDGSKGRAHFFILEEIRLWQARNTQPAPELPASARRLADIVEASPELQPLVHYLLGNAWLLEGLNPDTAFDPFVTVVDTSGAILTRGVGLSGGSIGLFEGQRIGRAKTLEKLGPQIKSMQEQVEDRQQQLAAETEALQQLAAENPAQRLEAHLREMQLTQRQLSVLQAKDDEYQAYLERMRARSGDVDGEIQRLARENEAEQPRREQLQDELHQLTQQLDTHRRELDTRSARLSELTQRHNQENIRFVELKNRVAALKKDFMFQRDQLAGLDVSAEKQREELDRIRTDLSALAQTDGSYTQTILQLYETKATLATKVQEAEEKVAFIKNAVFQQENTLREERRRRETVQERYTTLKDRLTEIRIQENAMVERMQVEFQIEVAALRPDELFDQPLDTYSLTDIEAAMLRFREQLNRFGEVNPTAIEAYQEIKERFDFINTQRDDLVKARENLLETMREMDETALAKFNETFAAIRENFQRVFRTLFTEEDTCDLTLVRPDDPLESPIEIMARPKGKRPLTITQLSGGEKTLTATSLLFAIYLIKPAPFCIFDEVDAPLDDANVDKFTNIIREFSRDSQFIIVTHNKRTMARTSVIYGVTMEETGVSRVLPVDLVALKLA